MEKYIITTQVREWYGDEAHIGDLNYGRYKMKGGQEFIVECDESLMYDEAKFIFAFNQKHDKNGLFFRHEAKSIDFYIEPIEMTMLEAFDAQQ